MKINSIQQLKQSLKSSLAPIYLVSGDEPYQVESGSEMIRSQAKKDGFLERTVYHAEADFSWNTFITEIQAISLFSDKKIVELRVSATRLKDGKKILGSYAKSPDEQTLLLVITTRIDSNTAKTKWFKSIEVASVWLSVWPIEYHNLPKWIKSQCDNMGLKIDNDAIELLAERVEGNLLAADQEIKKLQILATDHHISRDNVLQIVSNNSRYDVFSLLDAVMGADGEHSIRIFKGLIAEGVEPIIVLWALTRELRLLSHLARKVSQGVMLENALDQVARQHKMVPFILKKRKYLYQKNLSQHSEKKIREMLEEAFLIDMAIKTGDGLVNIKDSLLTLLLKLTGIAVFKPLMSL